MTQWGNPDYAFKVAARRGRRPRMVLGGERRDSGEFHREIRGRGYRHWFQVAEKILVRFVDLFRRKRTQELKRQSTFSSSC